MKKIVIISLIFLSYSCSINRQEQVATYLTNNNHKYWDVIDHKYVCSASVYTGEVFCFCYFDSKGTYNKFFKREDGLVKETQTEDLFFENTWELITDSSILLRNELFYIKKITNDTLKLYYVKGNYDILLKAHIPPDTIVLNQINRQ